MVIGAARYDAAVIGGGHNGLVAACYLADAGRSVVVLERAPVLGGAVRSEAVFPGFDARLSKFSYLVSLLPAAIVDELGIDIELRRRRISSYTPIGDGGLLIDEGDPAATAARLGADADGWFDLYATTAAVARRVFPTLLEPLRDHDAMRAHVADDAAWSALFERPLGELIESRLAGDAARGVVLTDALIGTFSRAHARDLRQNRCFLYHVIGGGSGHWDVPVGGMGTISAALATSATMIGSQRRFQNWRSAAASAQMAGATMSGIRINDSSTKAGMLTPATRIRPPNGSHSKEVAPAPPEASPITPNQRSKSNWKMANGTAANTRATASCRRRATIAHKSCAARNTSAVSLANSAKPNKAAPSR